MAETVLFDCSLELREEQLINWQRDVLLFANSIGCTVDELHFLYASLDDLDQGHQLTILGTSSQLPSVSNLSYHPT